MRFTGIILFGSKKREPAEDGKAQPCILQQDLLSQNAILRDRAVRRHPRRRTASRLKAPAAPAGGEPQKHFTFDFSPVKCGLQDCILQNKFLILNSEF